jgi:NADPH2:quinone reductase
MRAIVIPSFGEPEVLALCEMPVPHPGPHQVSIRVAYVGVNYADVLARRNRYHSVMLPFVPGMEVSGYIHEIGEDVKGFYVGQPVAAFTLRGGYAEFALAQAALTFPLDDAHDPLDLTTAAASLAATATAYDILTYSAHLQAGETILIHSAARWRGKHCGTTCPLYGSRSCAGNGRKRAEN